MDWHRGNRLGWAGSLALFLGLVATQARAAEAAREVCGESGWCWKSPAVPADDFQDAWAVDEHTALAVGPRGWVLHWRDGERRYLPSGTPGTLFAVWAASPEDAWAVGEAGAIVHWDGLTWTRVREGGPALLTVFGTRADDVWVGGMQGALLHWDGVRWSEVPSDTPRVIRALWASGPRDVWVSLAEEEEGARPAIRRWNGQTWFNLPSLGEEVRGFWGQDPGEVWVVGTRGLLARWTGLAWSSVSGTDRNYPFGSLRGSGPNNLWMASGALWRFDGQRMHLQQYETYVPSFTAIAMHGDKPVMAVGIRGSLARYQEGDRWDVQVVPVHVNFTDVWASSPTEAWVARSDGQLSRWDGASWSVVPGTPLMYMSGVTGSCATDVWAVGRDLASSQAAIAHFDGQTWHSELFNQKEHFTDVWALNANAAWVVDASGSIHRWTGRQWTLDWNGKRRLLAVHGTHENNVWAVGPDGAVLHWNGRQWMDHGLDGPSFRALWVSGPDDVWMAADDGFIWHWDGRSLQRATGDQWVSVTAFHGRGAKDVWAVGYTGALFHWDGQTWSAVPSGTRLDLYGVGGAGDRLFAVGAGTTVLQNDRGAR